MKIYKTFRFEAAHFLPHVPPGHKCARMHGHSYAVRVEIGGDPDPTSGMLVDFDLIKEMFVATVDRELDHQVLNDVAGLENPTVELLARWIFARLALIVPSYLQLAAVEVSETSSSGARVER